MKPVRKWVEVILFDSRLINTNTNVELGRSMHCLPFLVIKST